jgi:hypothetical protein
VLVSGVVEKPKLKEKNFVSGSSQKKLLRVKRKPDPNRGVTKILVFLHFREKLELVSKCRRNRQDFAFSDSEKAFSFKP